MGVNHNVTRRPFVRSWASDPNETVTTAAASARFSRSAGVATIVLPGGPSTTTVWRSATARFAARRASNLSSDDVLATTSVDRPRR